MRVRDIALIFLESENKLGEPAHLVLTYSKTVLTPLRNWKKPDLSHVVHCTFPAKSCWLINMATRMKNAEVP